MSDETVRLSGWVHRKRDHGHLLFVDVRDHYGSRKIVTDTGSPAFQNARPDSRRVGGHDRREVVARSKETVNPNLPTGEIEVRAVAVTVQSAGCRAAHAGIRRAGLSGGDPAYVPLPRFEARTGSTPHQLRSAVIGIVRRRMIGQGFTEFPDAILTASSPEARATIWSRVASIRANSMRFRRRRRCSSS